MRTVACTLLTGYLLMMLPCSMYSQTTIVSYGSTWSYLDNGSNQGTAWRAVGFNDASWATGSGELGYGDGDETTVVSYGPSSSSKYITTYFRKKVTIANPSSFANFTINVLRDDAFVVYVNGTEAGRNNITTGTVSYTTTASSAIEDGTIAVTAATSLFVAGENTIAVEIHQSSGSSTDISFDLELIGNDAFAASLTRGPYLQMGTQNSVMIRWRTSTASNSRVEIGTTFGTYPTVFSDATSTTEHSVTVSGLSADTKYYYRIGNTTNMGIADNEKFFTTLPPANTTRTLRFAAFGDCGRNDNSFQSQTLAQYKAYLTSNGIDAPDAWLLMGDNAYNAGTDAEYTSNFFGIFGSSILKNHKIYSTPGNHDYANTAARQNDHAVPYYDVYTMPTAAEAGGVPSGTEAYYSFNIGDIHFLALDAYGKENSSTRLYDTTGAQVTWIKNDLAANTKKWTIAFWHHPPYTKGSHDSDTESELIGIRENFIRILERNGVDLVINGHSHDYERSYLLKGYYKTAAANPSLSEVDFNAAIHTASQSSGKYDNSANSCPYTYSSGKIQHGTVYVVAGSAGADGGVMSGYPHNAFPFSQDDGGMLYFEVDNNRLDAKFIRRDGVIADKFTILKDVNVTASYNTTVGAPVTLTASWPGSHTWSNSSTTTSITVTPASVGSTNYTVTDSYGCVTDHFTVVSAAALPLSLLSFTAKEAESAVLLHWVTADETNVKRFRIERSFDGISFKTIGYVQTKEDTTLNRSYSYTDQQPQAGPNYYRLVEEDVDGVFRMLDTRKVILSGAGLLTMNIISLADGVVAMKIGSGSESNVSVRIMTIDGKIIERRDHARLKGTVNETFNLRAGVYLCHVQNDKGRKIVRQLVIY
jgi:hypothetical protein